MVIAWPIPLCGESGATTQISPSSFMTCIRVRIPGAVIPSSVVINIRGFIGVKADGFTAIKIHFLQGFTGLFWFNKKLATSAGFGRVFYLN